MLRTCALVDQFPNRGYEGRYRNSYSKALEIVERYLAHTDSPLVDLDPRHTSMEDILKTLLGEARYYTDTGFEDWQRVIMSLLQGRSQSKPQQVFLTMTGGLSHLQESMLREALNNVDHFLTIREYMTHLAHSFATAVKKDVYLTLAADERAEAAVLTFVGATISSTL